MEAIFTFAKTATPSVLLALCLVIIVLILLSNNRLSLSNVLRSKEPAADGEEKPSLKTITKQLKIIAGNHLHDLPEMKVTLDTIAKEQIVQGNRLTAVETKVDILLKP